RLRLRGAADDLRGQRQAVHCNRIGAEQCGQIEAHQHTRAQGAAPRDGALCIRALTTICPERRRTMKHSIRKAALLGSAAIAAWPALAADVTPERLANADKEPQNWLMNHRTYDAQRYSPLARINKDNVKNLKVAYAVPIGGTAINENLQATPLVEDGYMYVVDQWGIVYKIDVRSGDMGRIVWRMDPGQEKAPLSNRGAALWGNLVISTANYPARIIGTDKDTGKMVWETNLADQTDVQLTAAPLVVKDKVIMGAAGGDRGVRDW